MAEDNEIQLEIERAEQMVRSNAIGRVVAIIELLEQAITTTVGELPAADATSLTKWPVYAQGWVAAREACLAALAEVRKVGDRYEQAIESLGVKP